MCRKGNRVFTDLTMLEELEKGGTMMPDKQAVNGGIERALNLFPALKARL